VGGLEWIHLAHDRDRWHAVVNAVMNLRVPAPRSLLVSDGSNLEVKQTLFLVGYKLILQISRC
jgi:hypothetical protein